MDEVIDPKVCQECGSPYRRPKGVGFQQWSRSRWCSAACRNASRLREAHSPTKRCRRCVEDYPRSPEYYHSNRSNPDGLAAYCKGCTLSDNRQRWEERSTQYEAARVEYVSAHLDELRARARAFYYAHREEAVARATAWNKTHPQRRTELNKKHQRERRLRIRIDGGAIRREEWLALCAHYGNRCLCCGRTEAELTQDHVVPLSKGGSHTLDNLQPLCRSCNSRKKDRAIDYRPPS